MLSLLTYQDPRFCLLMMLLLALCLPNRWIGKWERPNSTSSSNCQGCLSFNSSASLSVLLVVARSLSTFTSPIVSPFRLVCWDLMLPEGRERGATNSLAWWSTTVRSSQVVTTPLPLSETIYGITWMTQPLPLRPFQRCYENKPICSFILTKTPHRAPKITILLLGLQVNEAPAPTVSSPTPATACPEQPVRMMCCWPRQTIL